MLSKAELRQELQNLSSRISETTRTISLGVLALVWLFLAGGGDKPVLRADPDSDLLVVSGLCVLLSLLADYLQYLFGYWDTRNVFARMEKEHQETAQYDSTGLLYRARGFAFKLKQFFAVFALVALFLALRGSI
ncbi:MAG: hypothetical protein O9256_00560 [Rhizobiaceae bacterium]|nr:hypothetical protein [Rhizobiaceae bacterium]